MNTMIVFLSNKNSLQIYLASIQFKDMERADMQNQPQCPPFEGRQHYCCQICSTPGSCASGITLVVCLLVDQLLHCIVFLRAGIVLERLDVFIVTMRGRNSAHNIPTFNREVQIYFCVFLHVCCVSILQTQHSMSSTRHTDFFLQHLHLNLLQHTLQRLSIHSQYSDNVRWCI